MKPEEVLKHYGNKYQFKKLTGLSASSLGNWLKWGYIPEGSQHKLERISKGALKTEWSETDDK